MGKSIKVKVEVKRLPRCKQSVFAGLAIMLLVVATFVAHAQSRPNILFVIADDQSFPHASAYGESDFATPFFDMVARRGVLFRNAFVAAPQCSPSRAAILTGRNIWQLEEAGTHSSYFPKKWTVFTDVLKDAGYHVGFTGKGWGPGNWKDMGWHDNPAGAEYNAIKFERVPYSGLSTTDYASNFEAFLNSKGDQPFFFWFGPQEPHREYEYGSGRKKFGDKPVKIPGFLPKHDSVANDLKDYALEISWFDEQLGRMIRLLEDRKQMDNTLIVVTADNGMAFPYAKANLQEYGIHVPLAICGPSIPGNRYVDDLVGLIDLAPTFLEFAGCGSLKDISGRSLLSMLRQQSSGILDPSRTFVLSGRERHTHARPDNVGYPARAIRTAGFLYIRNFRPERWPAGDPPPPNAAPTHDDDLKPIISGFEDIDDGPTKRVMQRGRRSWPSLFRIAFERRPSEQLYHIGSDPFCLQDLSNSREYATVLKKLRDQLNAELTKQGDPHLTGNGAVFDTYPRFGRMRPFPGFRERGKYNTQTSSEN